MKIYDINDIDSIVYELQNDKVVIMETDTQLALISLNAELIYALKKRSKSKQLITFVSNTECVNTNNLLFYKLANQFWPGPLTLIVDGNSYRIPNHVQLLEVIKKVKKIFSSSANISNESVLLNTSDVFKIDSFYNNDKLVIVNGKSHSIIPSTIFDIDNSKIIRKGIIYDQLISFLKLNEIIYDD